MVKQNYLLILLAAFILSACCKSSIPAPETTMAIDTIGVGILVNSQDGRADTLTIIGKEKQENILLPDVEQVAEGNVSFREIIDGANQSRRIVLILSSFFALVLFIILLCSLFHKVPDRTRLRLLALITLICGWTLYFVGYYFGGTASSFIAYSVRPLIAALGMFVGNTGYQELSPNCTRSVLFMSLFAIVHLVAILVSAIFVVNFFWRRTNSFIKGVYWRYSQPSSPFNIFFGINKQSILLARNIQKEKKGKERILFIILPAEDKGQREGLSLSQLFGFNTYNQEVIKELQDVKYAIKAAEGKPSDVETNDGDILSRLGLSKLKGLINHHKKTRIFILSDDEVENVKSTINLMQDKTIKGNNIDIYCHARKNRENGIVEKMAYLEGNNGLLNVHLVDTSTLAIHTLKCNVEYQPVSFVNPNTDLAVVDNPFTALILGFGETGRDALRFLYEFGAFADSKGNKSPFKCYAIDKQMDNLKGNFYYEAPAVKYNKEIELLNMSNLSPYYWTWYEFILPKLNYVVISLGDDRSNMQAASDLFEAACRVRHNNMENFKIFVRSYSTENEKQLESLVKFYNEKCGATGKDGKSLSGILVVFGKASDLFTYENIIDDETIAKARVFYEGYAGMSNQKDNWDERHRIRIDKTDENGKVIKDENDKPIRIDKPRECVSLNDINAVIRKEAQDIGNSLHIDTKLKLIGLTRESARNIFLQKSKLTDEQLKQKELLDYILSYAKGKKKTYLKDDKDPNFKYYDRVIKNIAICEHLRWNASHEMIGYELGNMTDEIKKKHNCLKPWSLLPYDIQDYDYNVMERSVEIVINEK